MLHFLTHKTWPETDIQSDTAVNIPLFTEIRTRKAQKVPIVVEIARSKPKEFNLENCVSPFADIKMGSREAIVPLVLPEIVVV